LKGILGQCEKYFGEIESGGTVAYAAQTPFIVNDTLRENILFGSEMREERYRECLVLNFVLFSFDLDFFSFFLVSEFKCFLSD
jgi:ABC-type iron transport system FetAB ATPase subunit